MRTSIVDVLRLYGIAVSEDDARWLVGELYRDAHRARRVGGAHDREGLDRELYAVALEPAERSAVLAMLDDCPDSLAELRGRLLQDHTWRLRSA